jgi:hypothetical protein
MASEPESWGQLIAGGAAGGAGHPAQVPDADLKPDLALTSPGDLEASEAMNRLGSPWLLLTPYAGPRGSTLSVAPPWGTTGGFHMILATSAGGGAAGGHQTSLPARPQGPSRDSPPGGQVCQSRRIPLGRRQHFSIYLVGETGLEPETPSLNSSQDL